MEPEIITEQPIKKSNVLGLPQAIIVAALLISAALVFASTKNSTIPREDGIVEDVTETDFVRGNKNAEVTIIEYADFSCPYCANHHPTLQKIIEESDGKVNWVYRNLPIINLPAAVASTCVGKIGGNDIFWQYSDVLMENQKLLNHEFMKAQAVLLGVDSEQYETCVNDPVLTDTIVKDRDVTKFLIGFSSTPYHVLVDKNGKMYPVPGALPYAYMKSLTDTLLKQ